MFNSNQMNVIQYCAEECERQGSGEKSVYDMLTAWNMAVRWTMGDHTQLTIDMITNLGILVEPSDNRYGLRRIPIYVSGMGQMIEKADFRWVPALLIQLIDDYYEDGLAQSERFRWNKLSQSGEDD